MGILQKEPQEARVMSTWQTYYHLVWATGDRTPLITDPIRPELYQYMQAKAKSLDCWFHAIGGIEDHVHLIVSIPPKLAIAHNGTLLEPT